MMSKEVVLHCVGLSYSISCGRTAMKAWTESSEKKTLRSPGRKKHHYCSERFCCLAVLLQPSFVGKTELHWYIKTLSLDTSITCLTLLAHENLRLLLGMVFGWTTLIAPIESLSKVLQLTIWLDVVNFHLSPNFFLSQGRYRWDSCKPTNVHDPTRLILN